MEALGLGDPREAGPYRLAGVLGAGGMGRVYLGYSRSGRAVAVKVVHSELALNPDFRARFAREIAAARAVSGVFTAAVVDADPEAERPWLATAYVEAPTLAQHVAVHGPLPDESLRFLAAGLAEALEAIHRAGVIHRDLKPSNVLLAQDGPRVIDFGIARALEGSAITGAVAGANGGHVLLGSPGFMAPEQLTSGAELGPACDVFCLGLVLCFAAGVAPYGEGPAQALLYRIVHEGPDLSDVPEGPRAVIAACLAKEPSARPTPAQVLDTFGTTEAMAPSPTVKMPRSPANHDNRTRVEQTAGPVTPPPTRTAQGSPPPVPSWPSQLPPVQPTKVAPATQVAPAVPGPWQPHHTAQPSGDPTQQTPYLPYSPGGAAQPVPGSRNRTAMIGIPIGVAAVAGIVALVAAAAGGSGTGGATGGPTPPPSSSQAADPNSPNAVNSGIAVPGGTLTYLTARKSSNFNPLDSGSVVDGLPYMSSVLPAAFIALPDASVVVNHDLLTDATRTATSPQTLVYRINPKAVWNDGVPITADDFKYTWFAQSGQDPHITDASSSGYQDIASITGADGGKTVTVVFKPGKYFGDWKSLFTLLPAHIAAQHGYQPATTTPPTADQGLESSWTYFGTNLPAFSGGPFQADLAASDPSGGKVTLVRNPKWYGAVQPHLDKVVFQYPGDREQGVTAVQSAPNQVFVDGDVTTATEVRQAQNLDPAKYGYQVSHSLAWDHLDVNMKSAALGGGTEADQQSPAKLALRRALLTAVDRKSLVDAVVGPMDSTATPLNSRVFLPGEPGYTDTVTKSGLGTGDLAAAKKLLSDAGYTGVGTNLTTPDGAPVPALVLRSVGGNPRRAQENQLIKDGLGKLGVTVDIRTTDNLLDSLNHVSGKDYDLITFGWTPTAFPLTGFTPIWAAKIPANQAGSQNYAGFVDTKVDAKLAQAAAATDPAQAAAALNEADAQISSDAASLPLFQWESLVVHAKNVVNFRDNPTGPTPGYNMQEWGLSGS